MAMANNTSTRSEIIHMLKRYRKLTVTEMASRLGITEMAVRRHLNTLERDRLVETTLVRQAMGRPLNVYQLSEAADEQFPRNYSGLTVEFMRDIQEIAGEKAVHELFVRRENRLNDKYKKRMENKSFEQKVAELADIQNEAGYMVEWEKTEDGQYELKEFNCPIAKVANEYQNACSCELSLFQRMLGTDHVERTECLAKGGSYCKYLISEEKNA
ncbi:transcriptional regulator [Fictibacillus sp. WQ 8-8]|uniref:helix-turn-helix transcriptional regulator n=1 Tax=unclassified Fictibacillus TaxID=2644029 RepID=UPI0008F1891F|nr:MULTISPECIES: metalloregulator ArsR/SmtB family transcription factor [unclassified Fictibacillus]MCQ6267982.1 transcriptional regulator [Fictibacillus sp. WQ 8-8]MED2971215.1 transcriptional regulator [Fictibacillus sp. B-59209]UZJ80036.1 transcriptional regulator [Fictibacillus sp. KU28468]SFD50253.1 Predicted transcriptional regulator, ArsR family [Bacillus sp. OV194]